LAQAPKQETKEPTVDGFKIGAKRKAQLSAVSSSLAPLQFLELVPDGDALVLLHVESRDIAKNPYLFSMVYLRPDNIEILYTISPGMSPSKRRVAILRYFINLASLLEDSYEIDYVQLLQVIEASLKDLVEYVSGSYDDLYAMYDSLKNEHTLLKKKLSSLQASNDRFGIDNLELKNRNDALVIRVRELEAYSDEVMMLKIQEWLEEHNNEINVGEFSRVHKVPEQRVEEVLNKMVQSGLLKARE
jgi:hypothetical protein